jgi:hypothetical protein
MAPQFLEAPWIVEPDSYITLMVIGVAADLL